MFRRCIYQSLGLEGTHQTSFLFLCMDRCTLNCLLLFRPQFFENFLHRIVYFLIAGATQVKFNRKNEHLLASAHDRDLKIWDIRVEWNYLCCYLLLSLLCILINCCVDGVSSNNINQSSYVKNLWYRLESTRWQQYHYLWFGQVSQSKWPIIWNHFG